MTRIDLSLQLPDQLARDATAAGLLTPEAIEQLLWAAVRERRMNALFATADRLAAVELPPLSAEEIQAEIQAARAERCP